jgi:hypothetical protein
VQSCTTGANGTCQVKSMNCKQPYNSLSFYIFSSWGGISYPGLTYDYTYDHDPDGDSDGKTIWR